MDKFEQEQLRKLRGFAKRYGLPIGAGLIIVHSSDRRAECLPAESGARRRGCCAAV